MRCVVLDLESYFDNEYSLSRMSTEAYVRDSRFEAHGAAIKWDADHAARWYDERQLRFVLANEDWSDVFLIAHHAQFDGFILATHYNVHPKMWGCTLSMARLVIGTHLSVSLDSVRSHFGIPAKRTPYNLFKGKHWHEMTADVQQQVAEGACDEVESIWKIFQELGKTFPREEYAVIDATIRMFTKPVLRADTALLGELWESEHKRKKVQETQLGISAADLQSAERFKALLEAEGIEIEYKEGGIRKDGTTQQIPAFAKTDEFMRELLEHPNDRIRGLAEARIGAKGTLLQTRAETLGWMASRGSLPVYLRYCGSHTTRWSGGDGCLSGETKVLVFDWQKGLINKKIVDILLDDLVWDGEEFVAHEGIIFQGYREVITHDGITGTPDHKVYIKDGSRVTTLEEAAKRNLKLERTRKPTRKQVHACRKGALLLGAKCKATVHK